MVLPFKSNTPSAEQTNGEPPRILTEEEQLMLTIDKGVHEVNRSCDDRSSSVCSFMLFFSNQCEL